MTPADLKTYAEGLSYAAERILRTAQALEEGKTLPEQAAGAARYTWRILLSRLPDCMKPPTRKDLVARVGEKCHLFLVDGTEVVGRIKGTSPGSVWVAERGKKQFTHVAYARIEFFEIP